MFQTITKYASLSHEEFLRVLDQKTDSPIIQECMTRFERYGNVDDIDKADPEPVPKVEGQGVCPVCDATLDITYDAHQSDGKEFTVA